MRRFLLLPFALATLALPLRIEAQGRAKPPLPSCKPFPPTVGIPWEPSERLYYDVDVMGALAGKLTLMAHPPLGKEGNQEIILRAMAASNSFFSKIRQVRGRSASYLRTSDFRPRRYTEETQEGPSQREANVVFANSRGKKNLALEWKRDGNKGKSNFPSANDAFDPVSAAYVLRTIELQEGQDLCFDSYGIRKLWRVAGRVKKVETVKVPAGTFQAYRLEGTAYRVDNPLRKKEIHIWISADEKRLPLAAMSEMDLGIVRAQLTQVGGSIDEELEDAVLSDLPPPPAAPKPARRLKR